MDNYLCPANNCLCRCEPELNDYCHYSDAVAKEQQDQRIVSSPMPTISDREIQQLRNDGFDNVADYIEQLEAKLKRHVLLPVGTDEIQGEEFFDKILIHFVGEKGDAATAVENHRLLCDYLNSKNRQPIDVNQQY